MPTPIDTAARLRAARELFERAQRDGVSMQEARERLHRERWEAATDRLERKRAATGLCGTASPRLDAPTTAPSPPADAPWMMRD